MIHLPVHLSKSFEMDLCFDHDREVGVCSIPGIGAVGEAMISTGACERWRW